MKLQETAPLYLLVSYRIYLHTNTKSTPNALEYSRIRWKTCLYVCVMCIYTLHQHEIDKQSMLDADSNQNCQCTHSHVND